MDEPDTDPGGHEPIGPPRDLLEEILSKLDICLHQLALLVGEARRTRARIANVEEQLGLEQLDTEPPEAC